MRLKRENDRGQSEAHEQHFARTARRAALHRTERSTKRLMKTALLGIYDAKPAAGSAGPEARYGSVRTSKDH